MVGDDRGRAVVQRLEHVGVGHQAEALVPGIVTRCEMGLDIVAGVQLAAHHLDQPLLGLLGVFAELVEEEHAEQHIPPADDLIGQLGWQVLPQPVRHSVLGWSRDHIGG